MFDSASKARLRTAYPDLAVRAIRFEQDVFKVTNRQIRITEVIRTFEYQASLYAIGRTLPGKIVTNSLPGESVHHYGLAFDICFAGVDPYLEKFQKAKPIDWIRLWSEVGKLGQANGLIWGYDWNGNGLVECNDFDRPHFQITYGYRIQEIRNLYQLGGMPAVWASMDKVRGVAQGSEWNGITTKSRLLEIGLPA